MTDRASFRALWRKVSTDGCTASPDLYYRKCCDDHDRHYRTGCHSSGNPISRLQADNRLFRCMMQRRKGWPVTGLFIPALYWIAVRVAGWRFWKNNSSHS